MFIFVLLVNCYPNCARLRCHFSNLYFSPIFFLCVCTNLLASNFLFTVNSFHGSEMFHCAQLVKIRSKIFFDVAAFVTRVMLRNCSTLAGRTFYARL